LIKRKTGFSGKKFWSLEIPFKTGFTVLSAELYVIAYISEHRPPLPPGNIPGIHFQQGLSRPQGHGAFGRNMSLKNPVTPPRIDPGMHISISYMHSAMGGGAMPQKQ